MQTVSGLDPFALKKGSYHWQVPIFSYGMEYNDRNHKRHNLQFIQVGCNPSYPADTNVMYTQDFYLFSSGSGDSTISGHPISTNRHEQFLQHAYSNHFICSVDGLWGSGVPVITHTGTCQGSNTVFPAGPNLDYEYGSFKLPTAKSPWTATPSEHCTFPNKKIHKGCTNVSIRTRIHYTAQKINVAINKKINVFAEFGSAYRRLITHNLRYICKHNVYLKNILPTADCLKKSYLSGGGSYPYFSVGYTFTSKKHIKYTAQYIYIPEAENQNRLAWNDAAATQIYTVGSSQAASQQTIRKNLLSALHVIREKNPALYKLIGKHFFMKVLNKTHSLAKK